MTSDRLATTVGSNTPSLADVGESYDSLRNGRNDQLCEQLVQQHAPCPDAWLANLQAAGCPTATVDPPNG